MLKRILAPTDFSPAARVAVDLAGRWAQHFHAELILLHVDEDVESGFHDPAELVETLSRIESTRQEKLEELRFAVERLGVRARIERRRGAPAEQIARAVPELEVDLLVIATHGRRGLRRLMGTTTTRILRRAPSPVLTVSERSAPALRDPFTVARVLYPTDFSPPALAGLRWAAELVGNFGAELEVAHVLELPSMLSLLPGEPALGVNHPIDAAKEQGFRNKLDEVCATAGVTDAGYRVLVGSSVGEALADCAQRYAHDLVVVPSQGHGALHNVLFGSVAEALVELCTRPVLVLPPGA
jgi:nucleotide-binding universal stress UspA family protein